MDAVKKTAGLTRRSSLADTVYRFAVSIHKRGYAATQRKAMKNAEKMGVVKWTPEQKTEFDSYWKKHYGKTIPSAYHRFYETFNGVRNVRYFPPLLCSVNLLYKMNPNSLIAPSRSPFVNKALFEVFFGGASSGLGGGVSVPETLGFFFNGIYYTRRRRVCSLDGLLKELRSEKSVCIKPLSCAFGRDVQILNIEKLDSDELKRILEGYEDFIIQEKLEQSPDISKIYPKSVNTIRVVTYICDNNVFAAPAAMRIGAGGSVVDNFTAGGIGVGIHSDGKLRRYGYIENRDFAKIEIHPDTGIRFEDCSVPNYSKVLDKACELHGRLPGYGLVSWDFALGADNEPVLIEINIRNVFINLSQIANGLPIFGDNTEKMIAMAR